MLHAHDGPTHLKTRVKNQVSPSITLSLILFRQGLSENVKLITLLWLG